MEKITEEIIKQAGTVIRGKDGVIREVYTAIIAGGNILIEDIPGVGKTTLAKTFSEILSLNHKRIQFTPDTLPSDITGFSMYDKSTEKFVFEPGAVFSNLLLADEINRTSPKTQSALLEAMEEGTVTVDGITHTLPDPFIVIATENPTGSSGTQKLPASQLDRFMVRLSMGYPSHEDAVDILKNNAADPISHLSPIIPEGGLIEIRKAVKNIYVKDTVYDYIVSITEATRTDPLFSSGASPRAMIDILKMSKARAYTEDRDFVTDEDVQRSLLVCLNHRIHLSSHAKADGVTAEAGIKHLILSVPFPKGDL